MCKEMLKKQSQGLGTVFTVSVLLYCTVFKVTDQDKRVEKHLEN